jgi:hypothetical protein
MPDPVIESLMHEYDQMSAYLRDNALISYRILPVVFTIGAGLVIYAKPENALVGPALLIGVLLVIVWVGLCHSMVNGLGLELAEIEQQVNRQLGGSQMRGLSHYTSYIGEGTGFHPGLKIYYGLLSIMLILVLCYAHVQFWQSMTQWSWSFWVKVALTALPVCLNAVAFLNLLHCDKETLRRKKEMIQRYRDQQSDRQSS